jgi:hypothetical protein
MRWLLLWFASACWTQSTTPPPAQPIAQRKPVSEIVQPVKIEKQEMKRMDEDDDPCGGVYGGVVGGVVGGVSAPPPPPPPPPVPPQNVPPTLLEGNRIAGNKMIVPDDVTKTEIQRSGKDKLVGSWKLCLTPAGDVSNVTRLKSTGFSRYDAAIENEMRSNWRYRPYLVNGRAVPVCTAITFIYSQPLPPPPPPKTP